MNQRLRSAASSALGRTEIGRLRQRLAELEAEIAEVRSQNLRLAELTDVVAELLIPMAQRDQDKVDEAIKKFQASL